MTWPPHLIVSWSRKRQDETHPTPTATFAIELPFIFKAVFQR